MPVTCCPHADCAAELELPDERLGRAVDCPACGRSYAARPAELWRRLRQREASIRAGELGRAAPPWEDDPKRRRRYLYHAPDPAAAGAAELAGDERYEASIDRATAALPRVDLTAVLDDVRSQHNVGSIFRTADAAGFAALALAGVTGTPPAAAIAKTALGAEHMVPWTYRASVVDAIADAIADDREPIALELTADAVSVFELDVPPRAALVVGNEVSGLSPEALALCPRRVAIPMAGRKGSLNVSVAFGVAAFQLARAWRARHGAT